MTDTELAKVVEEAALEWLKINTNIDVSGELPANVKLFVYKFGEVMAQTEGVLSESLDGASQSFGTSSKSDTLWNLAANLLGMDCMRSRCRVTPAVGRWS